MLHYYQLFDWVYISKPEKLFEALIQWESQDSPTVIKSNLIGEKLEQSMLSSIYWLPGYLVVFTLHNFFFNNICTHSSNSIKSSCYELQRLLERKLLYLQLK